jgi:hypothetical protein
METVRTLQRNIQFHSSPTIRVKGQDICHQSRRTVAAAAVISAERCEQPVFEYNGRPTRCLQKKCTRRSHPSSCVGQAESGLFLLRVRVARKTCRITLKERNIKSGCSSAEVTAVNETKKLSYRESFRIDFGRAYCNMKRKNTSHTHGH